MKLTREMIEAAHGNTRFSIDEGDCVDALTAALAPYEAPPFVLSDEETYSQESVQTAMSGEGRLSLEDAGTISAALDRALKTLGVAQAAPVGEDRLTAEEREFAEEVRNGVYYGNFPRALAIIDRLAPKPAPAVQSVAELEQLVRSEFNMATQRSLEAFDELVRRANKAPK